MNSTEKMNFPKDMYKNYNHIAVKFTQEINNLKSYEKHNKFCTMLILMMLDVDSFSKNEKSPVIHRIQRAAQSIVHTLK